MPPCSHHEAKKICENLTTKWCIVKYYLNKYVVSIAPLSPPRIQKLLFFCTFSLFNFSSIFPGRSADPICPHVRTPMALAPRHVGRVHSEYCPASVWCLSVCLSVPSHDQRAANRQQATSSLKPRRGQRTFRPTVRRAYSTVSFPMTTSNLQTPTF